MIEKYPEYVDTIPLTDKVKRYFWSIVDLFLFKPFKLSFFNSWRVFLLRSFGANIGNGSVIHASVQIPSPWNLSIGEKSCIGPDVKLHIGKTIIGSKVTISQRTYLCSASHDINSINTPFRYGYIKIEDFVWIAAEAFIMMNVEIGEGAVVGARSAVFGNVESWNVVRGNPAKFIKMRKIHE